MRSTSHQIILTIKRPLIFLLPFLLLCLSSTPPTNKPSPLSGPLADCCCSAETISHNNANLQSLLQPLVTNSTYFSVFHVALLNKCPFWPDDGTCALRDCSVCECPDEEVPRLWREEVSGSEGGLKVLGLRKEGGSCGEEGGKDLMGGVSGVVKGGIGWEGDHGDDVMWTAGERESDMVFVDLRRNVERYTGYDGEGARRIWRSIYEENCFRFARHCRGGICTQGACKEERVLYRLISGIHTSINMHIAKEYLFPDSWGIGSGIWKPNVPLYVERVKMFPERIENLYFTFAVILRAVAKASESLMPSVFDYSTGDGDNDAYTRATVENLLKHPLLAPGCTTQTFDESDMFLSSQPSTPVLLSQFKGAFSNISTIMDCVGCEKCRVWGKLQFLGVGTALRILFEKNTGPLKRNEVIALINLMFKLSTSIEWVNRMETMITDSKKMHKYFKKTVIYLILACLSFSVMFVRKRIGRGGPRLGTRDRTDMLANEAVANGIQSNEEKITSKETKMRKATSNGLRQRN